MLSHVLAAVLAVAALVGGYFAVAFIANAEIAAGILFGSFGLLLGLIAVALFRRTPARTATPPPVHFVPHWFLMAALGLAALLVLAAILLPALQR